MKDTQAVGREPVEASAEPLLAEGAGVPGGRRLRVVAECEDEAAELRVLLADASFALGPTALVFAAGADARSADVDGIGVSTGTTTGDGFEARLARTSTTEGGVGFVGEPPRQRTVFVVRS
jgi:hypothetical protein